MLTLECFWVDTSDKISVRHTAKFQGDCVGTLIQQAFLQKMAVNEWVGYRILDAKGLTIVEEFPPNALARSRFAQARQG